ncbi:hypothetical protein ACQE3E_00340 [Methylomonas sp. MED-D]|uniref:Uncharacterized protein n=1 Tax=Methylomonas koyamae TaxID=702114 RepID=A0A177P4W7_9GAMM|nr:MULTISPECIES: hypothetical protein [Methylomonas]NJA06020.1 hypothetical protein [Methylococcaceae bacterium WWC4]MDT4330645.1 hypothetical protein [Methylomonas sp. MV1]OAI24459.1 hypothetical protein A1355_20655 [Methylomonas koyamae]OHX34743.1 hypothetical protein BJL95_11640 [Methylomonas sp. LWB]WGS86225.1 hypothetical protein QC632_00340 [Methylomonas sp. UP202]
MIKPRRSNRSKADGDALAVTSDSFPSARYFQIHFEYLHEMIGDLRQQIGQANQQIAELQRQLRSDVDLDEMGSVGYQGESQARIGRPAG